jgi:hypothetical protein
VRPVTQAWGNLPEAVKAGIVAMVEVATKRRACKNSPAGPSNLAAYQTCRAGFLFGRTASSSTQDGDLDFALARSAGISPANSG